MQLTNIPATCGVWYYEQWIIMMRQLYCATGKQAISAIQNPDIELTRGKGFVPSREQLQGLFVSGGYSSNLFSGSPKSVSLNLASQLLETFGTKMELNWLMTDIDYLCGLFENQSGFSSIGARFFIAAPDARNAWADYSDYYHVDILRNIANYSGFKFIKCYHGPGTQWVASSNVNRLALVKYITKYIDEIELVSRSELKFLNRQILLDHSPQNIFNMGEGEFIFFKCGLQLGLIHRAPPITNTWRIFLTITIQ